MKRTSPKIHEETELGPTDVEVDPKVRTLSVDIRPGPNLRPKCIYDGVLRPKRDEALVPALPPCDGIHHKCSVQRHMVRPGDLATGFIQTVFVHDLRLVKGKQHAAQGPRPQDRTVSFLQ